MRIYRIYKLRFLFGASASPYGSQHHAVRYALLVSPVLALHRLSRTQLKTSVEWGLKRVDFYFWQGTMRRNNALLQRIVTQQKLTSGVL